MWTSLPFIVSFELADRAHKCPLGEKKSFFLQVILISIACPLILIRQTVLNNVATYVKNIVLPYFTKNNRVYRVFFLILTFSLFY